MAAVDDARHSVRDGGHGTATRLRRAVAIAGVWAAAAAVTWLVVSRTRYGPTLVATGEYGAHAGDLIAFVAAVAGAGWCTAWILRRDRRATTPQDTRRH
jgi:hypothetical protein